jgi:hypothetical protein
MSLLYTPQVLGFGQDTLSEALSTPRSGTKPLVVASLLEVCDLARNALGSPPSPDRTNDEQVTYPPAMDLLPEEQWDHLMILPTQ